MICLRAHLLFIGHTWTGSIHTHTPWPPQHEQTLSALFRLLGARTAWHEAAEEDSPADTHSEQNYPNIPDRVSMRGGGIIGVWGGYGHWFICIRWETYFRSELLSVEIFQTHYWCLFGKASHVFLNFGRPFQSGLKWLTLCLSKKTTNIDLFLSSCMVV